MEVMYLLCGVVLVALLLEWYGQWRGRGRQGPPSC